MSRFRIIPTLLLKQRAICKGIRFSHHTYVGDPINTVKLFNDLNADELLILNIDSNNEIKSPDYQFLQSMLKHTFIPVTYGGGINKFDHAQKLFSIGVDRIVLHAVLFSNASLISEIASVYGNQSVVACINVKNDGYVWLNPSHKKSIAVLDWAKMLEQEGVGEIVVQSIDREGTYFGLDEKLIDQLSHQLQIPLIISGGASSFQDIEKARRFGASGVSVGSMFMYKRPHRAVLIQYPDSKTLDQVFHD